MTDDDGFDTDGEGREVRVTDWERLPQSLLTSFEILTKSNDPLHMDPDWVRRHTDLPGIIAPGFLSLSLLPYFAAQLNLAPKGTIHLNYGFDRVRWTGTVPVDSEVRMKFRNAGRKPRRSGEQGTVFRFEVEMEIRGQEQPAMFATWLVAVLPDSEVTRGKT